MKSTLGRAACLLGGLSLALVVACAPTAPVVSPTSPAAAPAAPASPPSKPAVSASPASSAATAKPVASPALPSAPSPAAASSPAAKPASDQAVASFYRDKTVRVIVGTAPGGTFDTYSRLLAKYLPKYLPGSPTVIVENRPGAGGLLAANTVYSVEPQDGSVLLSVNEYLPLLQVTGAQGVSYDASKFQWLGASTRSSYVCLVSVASGVGSAQDLLGGKEAIIGTIGPANSTNDVPAVLNGVLGMKMKLVSGYQGFANIKLAVESGEIDGACGGWDGFILVFGDLLTRSPEVVKAVISLGKLSPEAEQFPFLRGVPSAEDLAKDDESRQILRAVNTTALISKPFTAGPGVPKERVDALRRAVASVYADSEFLAEAKRSNLIVGFTPGEDVQKLVLSMLEMPAPLQSRLKGILAP